MMQERSTNATGFAFTLVAGFCARGRPPLSRRGELAPCCGAFPASIVPQDNRPIARRPWLRVGHFGTPLQVASLLRFAGIGIAQRRS